MPAERLVIVGGGLAGLMTAIKAAEGGVAVDLFSIVPVKRSHSVCAQGGINGAVNTKGEGDSPQIHFDDTIYGGDFLADQPPVKSMCHAAPQVINLLDRMGVMFNRTPEGLLDFRRFGGTKHHRTAFAGATTGQQLLYALDEQVRRWEVEGLVRKYEYWEFLGLVRDDSGNCRGIVALDWESMKIESFPASAVMMATGGPGIVFGKSTNSVINTGSAAGACYAEGAWYANGEFIQVHPTSIPGQDKLRLMSESARGEGGRMWVPRTVGDKREPTAIPESDRWYFLEEKFPAYGNLVPRDIATREIFKICLEGKGIDGKREVYLDLTHLPQAELDRKLGGILEIYEKFVGVDPRHEPMKVFPGMHYSMGGLWTTYEKDEKTGGIVEGSVKNQATNVPGLYAAGEVDFAYHGANRLGANSLLSCIYSGRIGGPAMVRYARDVSSKLPGAESALEAARKKWQETFARLARMKGKENPHVLSDELGEWMTDNVTVVRENGKLSRTLDKIEELSERWNNCELTDSSTFANREIAFLNQLTNMLHLARVMTKGALLRDESRGAHFKVKDLSAPLEGDNALPRDDANFLKTTIAEYSPDGPKISYRPVDVSEIPPRARRSTDVTDPRTIRFKVKRQDAPNSPSYWEEFEVPYLPKMNVLACLMSYARHPVDRSGKKSSPICYDSACLEEVCGSCAMRINGVSRMGCTALVDSLEQPIVLEPMGKFPVVRDLAVDRSRMFNALKRIKGWIPIDGTHDLGPGPRMAEAEREVAYHLSQCITCGNCLDVCPQVNDRSDFIGAAAISQVALFNSHPTGLMNAAERLEAVMGEGGINDCGNAQNCVRACPKSIPLTTSIAAIYRATTIQALKNVFGK